MLINTRRRGFWTLAVAGVLLIILSLHRLEQLEALQNQPERPQAPLAVHAETAYRGQISKWVCGEGTVTAVRKRHMFFQTSGKVIMLGRGGDDQPLQEGDPVWGPGRGNAKGTFLAAVDSRELQEEIQLIEARQAEADQTLEMTRAVLAQAEKNAVLARKAFLRRKELFGQQVGTRSALEAAETNWQNARLDIKAAKARIRAALSRLEALAARHAQALIQLEKTALYAPFDGVVARMNIAEGTYFDPETVDHNNTATLLATAAITIVDSGALEITLNLPVFDGMGVRPGQKAIIHWGALDWRQEAAGAFFRQAGKGTDHPLEGQVYSVSPVLSIRDRTVRIKIRARQFRRVLPHGSFVNCWIETEQKNDVVLIPTTSLLFRNGQAFVYVEDRGAARRRAIGVGLNARDEIEVLEGVAAGERVITKGRYRLFPSRPVRVVNPAGV